MAITTIRGYVGEPGYPGLVAYPNDPEKLDTINTDTVTIPYGSFVVVADNPDTGIYTGQYQLGCRLPLSTDTIAARLGVVEYSENNEGANYQDGPQYLNAQGLRGVPVAHNARVVVEKTIWVYSETAITSINSPVFIRHTASVANPVVGRARTSAVAGETLDVSTKYEWVSKTSGPGPAMVRVK